MELVKEKAETEKRVAKLKEKTRLEQLRKEELDLRRECHKHTSIIQWIMRLFRGKRKDE